MDPYYLRHDGIVLPPSTPMFAMPSNIGQYEQLSKEQYHFYADLKKAIERGELETAVDLLKDNTFILDKLLDSPNSYNTSTPLLQAIDKGRIDFVKLLVNHGASVNGMDDRYQPPLHRACAGGHLDVVRYLLKAGASIEQQDIWHRTPLHMAIGTVRVEVISLLLTSGATFDPHLLVKVYPHLEDDARGVRRTIFILLQHGASVNSHLKHNVHPLHWALRRNDKDAAGLFLECDARPKRYLPRDCISVLEREPDYYEWVTAAMNGPLSLKCLCSLAIRAHLVETRRRRILELVLKLPLPIPLIKYLTLDRYEQWAS